MQREGSCKKTKYSNSGVAGMWGYHSACEIGRRLLLEILWAYAWGNWEREKPIYSHENGVAGGSPKETVYSGILSFTHVCGPPPCVLSLCKYDNFWHVFGTVSMTEYVVLL